MQYVVFFFCFVTIDTHSQFSRAKIELNANIDLRINLAHAHHRWAKDTFYTQQSNALGIFIPQENDTVAVTPDAIFAHNTCGIPTERRDVVQSEKLTGVREDDKTSR